MSKINVSTITNRTGTSGPVLSGVTTATNGFHVTGGSVGIGTDNPNGTLAVYGNASSSIRISKSGVLAYDHTFDGSTYTIANNNGSAGIPIILGTKINGGESVRIDSLGNIISSGAATLGGAMQSGVLRVKDPAINNDFIVATPDGTMYAQNAAGTVNWQLNPSGSIAASSVNLQSSGTSSWFQTGSSIASAPYVWAAKNSSSNVWHSGLQTDGDLYLGGNLASSNNIALNGSNGSGWFTGSLGIGGNATGNTMDVYEEGTYTPKLYAGTGTNEPAYNWRHGQYARVGEVVHIWAAMGLNGSMPTCTSAYLGNLPYNILLDSNNNFVYAQLFGYTWASGYGDSGDTERIFLQIANTHGNKVLIVTGGNKINVTQASIGSGQRFTFRFSYVAG